MRYNWQQKDWPCFSWDATGLEGDLLQFSGMAGKMDGMLTGLPEALQQEALVSLLVEEAVRTSAIEGEFISRPDVYSSIRRCLALDDNDVPVNDLRARGISETTIHARKFFLISLSEEDLLYWHTLLFQHEAGSKKISIGKWRTHAEPMQVISGPVGREKIHFEAPPSSSVPDEMNRYIVWFNQTAPGGKSEIRVPLIRAAISHLYFESIHPFEDGNGRIGRILSEKALAQGLGHPVMLSFSRLIERDKRGYYEALKAGQRSNKITAFIRYFVSLAVKAQSEAIDEVAFILKKIKFMDRFKKSLNDRQFRVIVKMLDAGPAGFEGGMSTKKYIALTGTSKATATRDLSDLVQTGALKLTGAGRNTRYQLELDRI